VALLSRWVRPPAELRRLLDGHERVLAVADTESSVAIATQLGLWLPEAGSWRRVGWDRVVKATWTEGGLHVVEGALEAGIVTDLPDVAVALVEPRNLPAVVRARVENSIVRSEQVQVSGGTARLVARRVPGVDGISWTARLDTGTVDSATARAELIVYLARAAQ
jgi:hypothetical protein